jgi:hypothetical protein
LFSHLPSKIVNIRLQTTTIALPAVVYGSETWFDNLSEGDGLSVFGNEIQEKQLGTKRDNATGGRRQST